MKRTLYAPAAESTYEILTSPPFIHVLTAFSFIMGLLWGSFFNVCVYRIPSGQAISLPASYCYACGTPIKWFDNVPVLSYFILGGRCRTCRAPFSIRYALIEFLTGCLFLTIFLQYGLTWPTLMYMILTGLLLVSTFTDIDNWIILDRMSVGGAVVGIVFALGFAFVPHIDAANWVIAHTGPAPAHTWWGPVANSLVGALSGAGLLYGIGLIGTVIFRKPAMGLGDVKLLMLIGAFGGWGISILSIFVGALFGSVWGIGAIVVSMLTSCKPPEPTDEEKAEREERIEAALGEDSRFNDAEKATLARLAREGANARPAVPHHLPFGPHLALAAWLLVAFEPQVMAYMREFFAPVIEYYAGA